MVGFAFGFAAAIGVFTAFALVTNSNLIPTEAYKVLAAAYFVDVPNRLSGDALDVASDRFGSLFDVLAYDPARLVALYAQALYDLAQKGISSLLEPPLNLMFLPGIVMLIARQLSWELGLVLVLVAAQTLLMSLAPFHPRYFLFIVPVAGAGLGQFAQWLLREPQWRCVAAAAVLASVLVAAGLALAKSYTRVSAESREIEQVVPRVRDLIPPSAVIVAYKSHLAFLLKADSVRMPSLPDPAALHSFAEKHGDRDSMYVFYGWSENTMRPQCAALASSEEAPSWLEVVASSQPPGAWTLYRYRGE